MAHIECLLKPRPIIGPRLCCSEMENQSEKTYGGDGRHLKGGAHLTHE